MVNRVVVVRGMDGARPSGRVVLVTAPEVRGYRTAVRTQTQEVLAVGS